MSNHQPQQCSCYCFHVVSVCMCVTLKKSPLKVLKCAFGMFNAAVPRRQTREKAPNALGRASETNKNRYG